MAGVKPGEINSTLQSLMRINKAPQKEGAPNGGVTITRNLDAGFISATVIFPVEEVEIEGGTMVRAIDFVEVGEPTPTEEPTT
jgi:hypothetical protein